MAARDSAHEKLQKTVSLAVFNPNKQIKAVSQMVHPLPHTLEQYLQLERQRL
jgi:uncharacterized protein GlcG (DUF336 family)